MWTRYLFLLLLLNGMVLSVFAQAPTTGASNFSITNNDGNRLRVNWTRGNGANVLVVASTSATFNGTGVPADGSDYVENAIFGSGNLVGAGNFVVYEGTGTSVTVTGLDHSTTYYFRIYEFNGINTATQYNTINVLAGDGSTLFPPTVASTNLIATVTGNSAALTWTRGNGTRSLVILQAVTATIEPTQYVNYIPSSSFGSGSSVGSGYVVHFSSSSSVNVTNLQPNTQYFYRVVEGNGPNGPVFDLTNALVGSFTTSGAPTVGSTNFSVTGQQGNSISISLTRGNGTQRLIVARQDNPVIWTPTNGVDYNVSASFGVGDDLGNNTFAVYQNTGSTFTMTGLTPATTYHFAVFEFNGTATNTVYLSTPTDVLVGQGSTLSPPSTSAGGFIFTSITGYQANVAFTAGNGARRIVLAKEVSAVTDVPVTLVNYGANASYPSAPLLGTSRIVYDGTGTSFTLRDLQPNKTYHLAIFEYNGSSGPVYKQADPGIGSFTTLGTPTVVPTNLTFSNIQGNRITLNFTTGDGYGRILIGKQGSPVDVFPTNLLSYAASTNFGSGADLGGGNFVLQNNTAIGGNSSASIANLAIGTTYHFALIEYNGTGTQRIYMTSTDALAGSASTLSAPTVQASNLVFSNITATSVTIAWTNGNGTGRTVLIRQGAAVASFPVDLSNYSGSGNYTVSPALGTGKILYDGTGSSVNVTNIPPGEYHVAIVEYNGSTGPVYRNADPLTSIVNIGAKPIVPASNLSISNIQGNRMTLSCTVGDGLSRMVIARAGSPVNAWPVDFTGYTASANFGSGADLGGGNFVVALNTGNSFTISNLVPSSTYHFAIVEVNGSGASAFYQESATAASISGTTLSAPTLTTSNFLANNIDGNSMQVTWTRGNGAGRFIIAKAGSPVDVIPADLTDPSSSTIFGSGTNLGGGSYAVYEGGGDNVTITNLEPGTTYHFASFEYNGTGTGKVYLSTSIGRASFTTLPRPTIAPKNLSISNINGDRFTMGFTTGNGTRRLIVLRKGGLVNALPVDLTTYTGGSFGVGSQLGTGNYVTTFTNANSSIIIQGLEPDTEYGVAVFEVDGSNGNQRYLTTSYINQLVRTSATPTISTSTMLYNSVGSTSINLSWTNGNGAGRMVVIRPFQPVTFVPTVLSTHGSNSTNYTSTSGNLPNSHKHVDRGNISTVTITNLTPGTTYHIAIYEYNGSTQPVYREIPLRGFFTTLPTSGLAIGGFDAITFCPAQQVDVPYFFTGVLGAGNVMSVELSDITGSFASPTVLGTQSTTNASGFVTSTLPASLPEGVGYRLRVNASNPAQVSADNGADLQITTSVQPTFTVVGGQVSSCGTPIHLSTSQPGYNLQWFKDSQPIPAATTALYSVTETGNYQVQIAGASGGCQLLSTGTTISISQRPTFNFQFSLQTCEGEQVDVAAQTLPVGGTFSGTGVSGGIFNSITAGVGQHILEYTYTDIVSSCTYVESTQVTVVGLPAAPTATGNTVCEGVSTTLVASGAVDGEYRWYDVASGGTALSGAVNGNFTTPVLTSSATYYVSVNNGQCESARMPATATTVANPVAPTTTGASVCDAGALVLTASGGINGQYRWYTVPTGGTSLTGENNETFTTPVLSATTTYYVSLDNGTCEGSRSAVEATVVSTPTLPTVTPGSVCGFAAVNLSASGAGAGQYRWYTDATGGTAIAGEVNAAFTTPALTATTTYYVSTINGTCESARVPVVATVNPIPAQPTINSSTSLIFCEGGSVILTASAGSGYLWSTGEITPSITVSSSASVTVVVTNAENCSSVVSAEITVTENPLPTKPLITTSGPTAICEGSSITLSAPLATSYTWSTGATTQSIEVATAGSFTVAITDGNGCTSVLSDPMITTLQTCASNQPPSIDTTPLATQVGGLISFNVLSLLNDPDDNLDLSTLQIITQPQSGAVATLDANGNLQIDYEGVPFTGIDRLVIQICDLAGSCTQQELTVEVIGDVEVYNAISPNGDNLNDVFIIRYIEIIPETAQNRVTIYNRWGDEVFAVSNYDNDTRVFKGLSNSGKELPSGTYFYKIEYVSGRPTQTGYLSLKR